MKDKTLLITGGTGSFGQMMLNHFLNSDIKKIKIFSRDEKKQDDLRKKVNDPRVQYVIGDVRDYTSISLACEGVNYIFQAAALKQVPSCEFYPLEAVKTNILGSENVLNAAIANNVERVVVLSTDKAVYPINAMGMSKALMEKLAIAKAREQFSKDGKTIISITRYGNVLFSRGSIIPAFIHQIKNNLPLIVTEKNMTRFLMSLDESVNLVLKAFNVSSHGDTFIQKSPSASVETIANSLLEIFSSKSEISVIGPRHGEKLHETLCSSEEMSQAIDLDKYFKIPADLRSIEYTKSDKKNSNPINLQIQAYDSNSTDMLSKSELVDLLLKQEYIQNNL
jgi:UDP-glucose 4-epimerase